MKITIDNLNTDGPVDYTPLASAINLDRTLNQPSRCTAEIVLTDTTVLPPRHARVIVSAADAIILFTGYIATAPIRTYAGEGTTGPIYRALLSAIADRPTLDAAPATFLPGLTHTLTDADGTLSITPLQNSEFRELANDITLSGAEEPTAYVTETFQGDSTTAIFNTTRPAFRSSHSTVLEDNFDQPALNTQTWLRTDPGSRISLTGTGLTINGGNGIDGDTTVTALNAIEMGGTTIVELSGVRLSPASDGMLSGFYAGPTILATCLAGFRVRQSSGINVLVPVVQGTEVGTVFTPITGHAYTLRLRLHCVEQHRVHQQFSTLIDGTIERFGSSSGIAAPMDVTFEIVDEGLSSNTPATILYDSLASGGTIIASPATCAFAVVNSTNLFASIATTQVMRPGSAWIVSTLPDGSQHTRLTGSAGTGVDCEINYGSTNTHSTITFFAGRIPVAGERIDVHYRSQQRSIARLNDPASIAAEALGGAPGTCRWLGKVLAPIARNSVDCESAAQAVLAFASSRTAAVAGTYTTTNPTQDIQPGDILAITSAGITSSLLIRSVAIADGHGDPELHHYKLHFANDWGTELADGIGLKLAEPIAPDATLPTTALTAPAQALDSLQQTTITSLTDTTLSIDAGTTPPTGGGFEVRRRDNIFGSSASDLVLRSPVRSFTIPRASQSERFYIRAYDTSTPSLYSRFSAALYINAPVS